MKLEGLSLIISSVALIPLLVYLIRWHFYRPKVFIRVGGEDRGEPIVVPQAGKVYFGVGTRTRYPIYITEVWIGFDDKEVDLFETKGAEQRMRSSTQHPMALLYPEKRVTARQHLQGNYFSYNAKGPEFGVQFVVVVETDETALPFPLDMFPAPKRRVERIVRFKIASAPLTLQEKGLAVRPGEALHVEGAQAQDAVYAATEKGGAQLEVRELLKEEDRQ